MNNVNDEIEVLAEIDSPQPWPDANRNLLIPGAWIDPSKRLQTFGPDEFEIFVLQWVHGYLKKHKQYYQIQKRAGAGDKGRDIVAWIEPPGVKPRLWDNYQCKHYKDPLTPSEFLVELGKLCYYTYRQDYTVPQRYYIVTHQGIGPKLQDLLDEPVKLRQELIRNWDSYCQNKITQKTSIPLIGDFKIYVECFDFSILQEIPPHELIEQHSITRYHHYVFGTKLQQRTTIPTPPEEIAAHETRYVEQIYDAFSDHLKNEIKGRADFSDKAYLVKNFDYARESFYSAESLKEFARDNLPDDRYFADLMEQFLDGLRITLYKLHQDGYHKMVETSQKAIELQIDSNVLKDELRPNDRVGMCHQLANEDKLKWVSS